MQKIILTLHATNENNSDYKEINMHSKIAFALVMGMMMTNVWAETTANNTSAEIKTTQADTNTTTTQPQVEVRVEDIDAPILE